LQRGARRITARKGKDKKMAKYRRGRINDAVAEELAIALGEVREPKVVNNFVSITRAEVAPDLKYASVYFSCIGDSKEAAEGLKKCTGMLRHHLAVTLNLRITPELNFVKDGSIEHGAKIAKLLEEVMGEGK
jgi:ribosome-binding factor A